MIAVGGTHTVAVDSASNVYTFGFDDVGQLGHGVGTVIGLLQSGTLGQSNAILPRPKKIDSFRETIESYEAAYNSAKVKVAREKVDMLPPDSLSYQRSGLVRQIACGKNHTLLLTESGIVWSWGDNSRGHLGHSQFQSSPSPKCVGDLVKPSARASQLACGEFFSACLIEPGGNCNFSYHILTINVNTIK